MPRSAFVLAVSLVVTAAVGTAQAQKQKRGPAAPAAKVDVDRAAATLGGADPDAAAEAARSLGLAASPRAVDALLDGLALGLHPGVAAAALESLARHRQVKSYDTVAFYLDHRNPRVRAAAVRAMGSLDDSRAAGHALAALRDGHKSVRAVAAEVVAARKQKRAVEPLLALLRKGDDAAAPALAALADAELARMVGELIGVAPEAQVAQALGAMLLRPDFENESVRVQVVRSLSKVPGSEALEQLSNYIESIPENPPRQSRREAEAIVESRLSGGS